MSTMSHEPRVAPDGHAWSLQLRVPEMWASLAIVVMWLSVLFDALFGPDVVVTTHVGDRTVVPSAIVVALFAFLATWVVARYGFRQERHE